MPKMTDICDYIYSSTVNTIVIIRIAGDKGVMAVKFQMKNNNNFDL